MSGHSMSMVCHHAHALLGEVFEAEGKGVEAIQHFRSAIAGGCCSHASVRVSRLSRLPRLLRRACMCVCVSQE
jgi:hypothetical protein